MPRLYPATMTTVVRKYEFAGASLVNIYWILFSLCFFRITPTWPWVSNNGLQKAANWLHTLYFLTKCRRVTKQRKMRLRWYVGSKGTFWNANKIFIANAEGNEPLWRLEAHGMLLLLILEMGYRVWTGFMWFSIQSSGWLLSTHTYWTIRFLKRRWIFKLDKRILAFQNDSAPKYYVQRAQERYTLRSVPHKWYVI
jgi:hypothetical protein